MKKIEVIRYAFIAMIFFSLSACSGSKEAGNKQSKLNFAPPGTNNLEGKIFIDETEVTNLSWREYMYWMRKVYGENSAEYKSTLPDTLVWNVCYSDFTTKTKQYWYDIESMVTVYLRHPKFSHYPVVGISQEQAKQFCVWRTARVNEVYYVEKNRNVTFPLDSTIVIPRKVEFRLPTEEEWELAAKSGFDTTRIIKNDQKFFYNTSDVVYGRTVTQEYERFIPMPDLSIKPDKYNRYHLTGNVAEMIDAKGIAKGGSYVHSLSEGYYSKRIYYKKPEYWLGFRCVCQVKE